MLIWLDFIELASYNSCWIYAYLCYRLYCMKKGMTIINSLLAVQFLVDGILCFAYVHYLMQIGRNHYEEWRRLSTKELQSQQKQSCLKFIQTFLTLDAISVLPLIGIIFCRFVYVRYAHGLLHDMGKLFHRILIVASFCFTLHWLLIWQLEPIITDNKFLNHTKEKICNKKIPLSDFAVKNKMINLGSVAIDIYFTFKLNYLAKKSATMYCIPKIRSNIINMKQNSSIIFVSLVIFMIDQMDSLVISYTEPSPDTAFEVWWIWQLLIFWANHIFCPLYLLFSAYNECPEFRGLKACYYPGTEKPRRLLLSPRRDYSPIQNQMKTKPMPAEWIELAIHEEFRRGTFMEIELKNV